jgi:hypothetical protein
MIIWNVDYKINYMKAMTLQWDTKCQQYLLCGNYKTHILLFVDFSSHD